jgi:hypothetical protein
VLAEAGREHELDVTFQIWKDQDPAHETDMTSLPDRAPS